MSSNSKSTSREPIGDRIRKLRRNARYSQVVVAKDLCISQAAYSLIENSQNGIVADHVIKLSELYGVTTDYILKGNKKLLEISHENGFLPLIKIEAHAGFAMNFHDPGEPEPEDYYRIPGMGPYSNSQKLFEIDGESMIPTIFPRDVVLCQARENRDNLPGGTLILLILRDSVIIKRFDQFDEDGNFIVFDDNPEKKQKVLTIDRNDIKQVMVINGKMTTALVPPNHMVSKDKLKFMEESIVFLKKELQKLNEKLNGPE